MTTGDDIRPPATSLDESRAECGSSPARCFAAAQGVCPNQLTWSSRRRGAVTREPSYRYGWRNRVSDDRLADALPPTTATVNSAQSPAPHGAIEPVIGAIHRPIRRAAGASHTAIAPKDYTTRFRHADRVQSGLLDESKAALSCREHYRPPALRCAVQPHG